MKSTGIVRKIDDLGRIVIPMELRRTMNIKQRESMEIFTDQDTIILKKFQDSCLLCGADDKDKLIDLKGKPICQKCVKDVARKAK